jgi:hypothetical protein
METTPKEHDNPNFGPSNGDGTVNALSKFAGTIAKMTMLITFEDNKHQGLDDTDRNTIAKLKRDLEIELKDDDTKRAAQKYLQENFSARPYVVFDDAFFKS